MTNAGKIEEATPLYYAERGMVWKRPVEKMNADGSTSVSLGFPICTMHEACEGQEDNLARMLTRSELHEGLVKALEEAKTKLEKLSKWIKTLAANSEDQAKTSGRFETLREACLADARNYRGTAKSVDAEIASIDAALKQSEVQP